MDAMEEHGTALDKEKKRVVCHYCRNEVCGFIELKYHLGGVGSDVVPCTNVPRRVKDSLFVHEMHDQVDGIGHHELPLKRSFASQSEETRRCQPKTTHQPAAFQNILFHGEMTASPNILFHEGMNTSLEDRSRDADYEIMQPLLLNEGSGSPRRDCMEPHLDDTNRGTRTFMEGASDQVPRHTAALGIRSSERLGERSTDSPRLPKQGVKRGTTSPASRYIGRFFLEAGIDPAMAKLPSFRQMIDSFAIGHEHNVPSCDDLNGWMLEEEVNQVTARVEEIKRSWTRTGCSIVLDSWKDQRGRSLINFLVDCPQGTVFLKSADVSDIVHDAHSLFLLLDMIIKEVGVEHVVQVISDDGSDTMENVGQMVMKKYRPVFWTLCADRCINAILEKIQMLPHVSRILDNAKTITRFIYGDESAVDLMRKQMAGRRLVETSVLKSVAAFVSLHNMVSERESIVSIFASLASCPSSSSADRTKGKAAAKLANDATFWSAAIEVLKLTDPIIGFLNAICRKNVPAMGILYEGFDQAKELIKANVGDEEARYKEVWDLIDDIWSGDLHSPLHVFAYYLNPSFFYNNMHLDKEVVSGLSYSISRMSENLTHQDLLIIQLTTYGNARLGFGTDAAISQRETLSPDLWWSQYAGDCAELQRVAVKVLSQKCSGSSKYKIRRAATEKFLEDVWNSIEEKRLKDIELVHNNICLWQPPSTNEPERIYCDENINPSNEWVLGGNPSLV